jgi:hypothetical protein
MKLFATCLIATMVCCTNLSAQNLDNPGDYMTAVSNAHVEMNQRYMAYLSASSHGKRARKVEKLRLQVLESITKCRYKTIELPYYKGDNTLRQSSIDYILMCYNVFNDDYARIVNMEDIAEQSFDDMQAYILLKEKVSEKLREASSKMNKASTEFAAKYKVNIIESTDPLGEKMSTANKVSHYYNKVYLVFFKCNWQSDAILKATKDKKTNDAEQSRNALIKFANEGLIALDTLKSFQGDASIALVCKQVLLFYKKSAENDVPKIIDFYLKEEAFNKLKVAMDNKSTRTKEDVDNFNKAVKDFNAAVNQYNQLNANYVNGGNKVVQDWENAVKDFYDRQIPYFK